MGCYRCGGDHQSAHCPELKRDRQIEEQTEILKAQERRALNDIKQQAKQKKAQLKAAREADPNYKSPTKKFLKFALWAFIFMFAFAGFAKLMETSPVAGALLVIGGAAFAIYRFFKKS